MSWCRQVVACGVVFMVILYHVQSFLVPVPDDRNNQLEYRLNCSDVATDPASFFCRYIVTGPVVISFKQVICNGSFAPFPLGHPIVDIYYPENAGTEPGRCVFNGPNIVTQNNIQLREYTAFLSMLWSDGYPGWFALKCYLPLDGSDGGGSGSIGSEPEDGGGGDGGGSEPEDSGGSEPEDGGGGDGGGSEPEDGGGGDGEPEDGGGGDGGGSEPEDGGGGDGGGSEPEDGGGGDGGDGGGSEPEDGGGGDGGDGGDGGGDGGDGGDGGGSEPEDGDGGGSEPEDGDGGESEPESSNDAPAVQDDGTSSRSPVIEFEPGCDGVERDEEHGNVFMSMMHVKTDLHMSVVAYCYNGSMVEFETEDTVNYYLKVYFEIEHYYEGECVFAKSAGETYNLRIETSWGERGDQIHTFTKNVQISCIFSEGGNKTQQDTALVGRSMVTDGFINYKGVEGLSDAVSVISLTVVNVLGQPLGVQEIDLGRTIKLKAESDGGNGELGISPLTCDVIGVRTNQRYQILRAGCGDGIIIPKDKGFVNEGCVSISPHFTTFTLSGDTRVRFQCNFTMCPEKCDGSTCHVRSRRSVIPAVSEEFLLDSGDP